MIYDDDMIEQICANVDLLEYISQSIELTKKNKDYFGRCPLHIDKTPSFSVTPSKNCFFCFGCGRGGGIIQYLTEYEGLSYDESVNKAAQLAQIDLSKMCQSETMKWLKKIKKSCKIEHKEINHKELPENTLNDYLLQLPQEWLDEGISENVMQLFGIRIDNRANRIIYPVYDNKGKLINIKGRTRYSNYKDMGLAKYINYYKVGAMDYFQGLNVCMPFIKQKNEVIVFESIKSVMKAFDWGYKNCISAEKHTLTDEQVSLLIQLKVNIVFAYDSDVSYYQKDVKPDIDRLKRLTNVFLIIDRQKLLGGVSAKNAPVDLGKDIWEILYNNKVKIT